MRAATSFLCWAVAGLTPLSAALTIAEINGNKFLSPYSGQTVKNVTGLLLAKGPNGIWIRSTTPDNDPATSEAVYVFSNTVGANLTVGDVISLDGKVAEYRANANYLYLTEITSPQNVKVVSSGNDVTPLVIGEDTANPPTVQFSSLDGGDIYALPNAVTNVSIANPVLNPREYGLDFWESLSGELVTIRAPTAIQQPNNYRDTWVIGSYPVTGRNKHAGITMTDKDSNPEAIIIGAPLDGTRNPTTTKMGDLFADVTGIVTYTFGFYTILPLTALNLTVPSNPSVSPTTLVSQSHCSALTVGDYNVENLNPSSAHLRAIAAHIVTYLRTPDLLFLQEIQDDSGPTDDGTVSANGTLSALVASIQSLSNVTYAFATVAGVDNQDGGAPGGNIRQAYLYKPEVVELYKPHPGGANDASQVLEGGALSFNPGRIEPMHEAWTASRKPVVAAWRAKVGGGKPFYTVNVHWSSKGGGTSLHGDARPPINGAVGRRGEQSEVTASWIKKIMDQDKNAKVIAAGDFNEFAFVGPMKEFEAISGMVDLDHAAHIQKTERYTYVYDMNAQALDHMYVSKKLAKGACRGETKYEHIHVNTWAESKNEVSDHDPSVALFNLC